MILTNLIQNIDLKPENNEISPWNKPVKEPETGLTYVSQKNDSENHGVLEKTCAYMKRFLKGLSRARTRAYVNANKQE